MLSSVQFSDSLLWAAWLITYFLWPSRISKTFHLFSVIFEKLHVRVSISPIVVESWSFFLLNVVVVVGFFNVLTPLSLTIFMLEFTNKITLKTTWANTIKETLSLKNVKPIKTLKELTG